MVYGVVFLMLSHNLFPVIKKKQIPIQKLQTVKEYQILTMKHSAILSKGHNTQLMPAHLYIYIKTRTCLFDLRNNYPDYIDAQLRLAAIAKARNNVQISSELIADALKGNWNYFAAIRSEKRTRDLDAIHLEKAKELYMKVLLQHNGNLFAANGAGVVLAEKGQFDISKELFTQVQEGVSFCPDARCVNKSCSCALCSRGLSIGCENGLFRIFSYFLFQCPLLIVFTACMGNNSCFSSMKIA
ncbi:hypothetical protein ACH5RR_003999 [Cinchona calisaya]|uniref:Uncharacterized protein n=1 Tax=Cinchona calisaya TaxID=153742 RepID=A0ABD3AWE3_9GENT